MAWVSLDNLTRFYTKLKEKIYSKTEVDTKIDVLNTAIANISPLSAYPVGSIYMSINSTNPSTLFGGTWEQLKDRFLIGAGNSYAVNATGGEASHVLTTSELPSHNHTLNNHTHSIPSLSGSTNSLGAHRHYIMRNAQVNSSAHSSNVNNSNYVAYATNPSDDYEGYITRSSNSESNVGLTNNTGNHTHNVTTKANTTGGNNGNTSSVGSNQAHNNMPPYLAVYMWKRTA